MKRLPQVGQAAASHRADRPQAAEGMHRCLAWPRSRLAQSHGVIVSGLSVNLWLEFGNPSTRRSKKLR